MARSYKAEITLNEKDSLQDMLNLEKQMVKVYGTAMTEGASKGFRNLVKNHWSETVKDQFDVYSMLTDHGYLQVQSAPKEMLKQQKDKFSKVSASLC